MATIAAKAKRRAEVNQRLVSLSAQIADMYGVEVPPVSRTTRDPELDQIIELERIADVFGQLVDGSDGESGQEEGEEDQEVNLEDLKLDDLKARAIDAGHDAELVNKKRSRKDVIAILNGESGQEEGED